MPPSGQPPFPAASTAAGRPAIPDYARIRCIGRGAYGEVWLARSTTTGALRAVKLVYRANFTDERPFLREFEGIRKFEAISRSHPTQLALFHVGRDDAAGCFYYVMELADPVAPATGLESATPALGEDPYEPRTLRSDLADGRLPAARVLELGVALSEALAHLHGHGLVHRDVKPSNIIFVGGRPKLADIGLVTDASDQASLVGTEGYLPPEGPGTPAADVFALGKVLYEALTGLDRRRYPELPADLRAWPDARLAFELNSVLVRACAASGGDRYAGAATMHEDLKRLADGHSVRRRWAWRHRRRAAVRGAMSVAVLLLAAWGLRWYADRGGGARKESNADVFEISGTTNHAAWEAYRIGAYHGSGFTQREHLLKATPLLEKATELDPNWAAAHEALAWHYQDLVHHGPWLGRDGYPKSKAAAMKALALDATRNDARMVLARAMAYGDHDWTGAEREFRLLLARSPRSADYHASFGLSVLLSLGRIDEAVREIQRAIELDPPQKMHLAALAGCYFYSERYGEALDLYQQAKDLDPDWEWPRVGHAETLGMMNRAAEAIAELESDTARDPTSKTALGPLGFLYAVEGRTDRAREILGRLLADPGHGTAFPTALVCAGLGDADAALTNLERIEQEGGNLIARLRPDPRFKALRSHPRFRALLQRVRLDFPARSP